MSLVFSLSAALAATLVQQWVREYVHIFQRYSHPLKCARIRQFLYDGSKRWHMDAVVNLVPALIHIYLFLFFLGLADFLFAMNTATATTTIIVICALCYVFTIVAPIFYTQSPFQSPLCGVFWHLFFRTVSTRTFKDHRTGEPQRISTNMTEGRVQLAMDWSDDRRDRDAHAIKWVVDDLTEDSELEPLIRNIPDFFNSDWGKKVWEVVAKDHGKENAGVFLISVVTTPQTPNTVQVLFLASMAGSRACLRRAQTLLPSKTKQSGNYVRVRVSALLRPLCFPWNTSGLGSPNRRSRPWPRCSSILATTSEDSAMPQQGCLTRHPAFVGRACPLLSCTRLCRPPK